jgi:hypothetical protein
MNKDFKRQLGVINIVETIEENKKKDGRSMQKDVTSSICTSSLIL